MAWCVVDEAVVLTVHVDVGCGSGILFATACEYGFDGVGIDARKDVVDALSALGECLSMCICVCLFVCVCASEFCVCLSVCLCVCVLIF